LQEERNLLGVVFMLHQQTRVLPIHELEKLPRKLNFRCHITKMAEVCHFVWCCSLWSCGAVIFELLFRLNHGTVILFYKNMILLGLCCNNWTNILFTFRYYQLVFYVQCKYLL
jgi:hypothetical protein